MKPQRKLHLLKLWIERMIDRAPKPYISFNKWLVQKYPAEVPGTAENLKKQATHCFYCNRKFNGTIRKTIDHWIPRQNGTFQGDNRYAIVCEQCNAAKSNKSPEVIIKTCNKAILIDGKAYGLHGRRLRIFHKRMVKIFNDNMYGVSDRVYFKSFRRIADEI